jgi:hypothetical protein
VPVNFKGNFFSVLNLQLQSSMLDFKFRIDQTEKVTFKSVAEFLFGKEDGSLPKSLQIEQAKLIHTAYKLVVDRMHEKLRKLYEKMC